ncbi:F-type conjugal transfer pilus assembly protein TraB [Scandinavium goeteborgense]|uniref:Conjugal transfer pilus assembly protein TraB n=1 Tax=Scandinavium goeteborgense TaxID=1851514 RepID=A0A4R6E3T1_SCAGO|nr:F-type conjugal transfer pilus assembly protein TraB [Scandinavium goeteborgense]TDN51498.1 conjugal transfer pilus assembly protein TraB [Scandinavium goeteborgense]
MANLNKIIKRRQVALFVAIALGIVVGGGVTWGISNMNLKREKVASKPKEPPPNLTGVVNETFDSKVENSAVAEAKRINHETQQQLKTLRNEMSALSRDLKNNQQTVGELKDENQLLQTQLDAYKNPPPATDAAGIPVPGADVTRPGGRTAGAVPPPTNFWPAGNGAPINPQGGAPVLTPVEGEIETTTFAAPSAGKPKHKYPWIPSGSFARAVVIEGADANASVTGNKNTAPMELRITGKVQMPNDREYDATGCFVTLETYGDVSSERAEVRTRSISCQKGDDIIDQKFAGHVSFRGKNGIKGRVVLRNGKILGFAFGSGFLEGIGKGIEAGGSTTVGVGATAGMSGSDIVQSGVGGGVSSAAKILSDYYIKRAEQYHEIIPIGAGNEVTLVFQDGFQLESVDEARAKKTRRQHAATPSGGGPDPDLPSGNTAVMLKKIKDFKLGGVVDGNGQPVEP